MSIKKFAVESPQKVLNQAQQFRKTLADRLVLPLNRHKSMHVENIAEYNLSDIKYGIDRAKYQNHLFRKLQKIDEQNRSRISRSLLLKDNKIQQCKSKHTEKQSKKYQIYGKHFVDVQKRYEQEEKKKFTNKKEEAIKLRKQLKQFYQKEQQRKIRRDKQQISVPPCYSNALQRISKIHKKNQQFSMKAEKQLQLSFIKNSPLKNGQHKFRASSFDFRKSQEFYQTSLHILNEKEAKFIQTLGRNETTSIKAFQQKQDNNMKQKKRINDFFKSRTQKWRQQKKRIEQKHKQIPHKCTNKLDRTQKSFYRHTFSNFKDSFSSWRQNVSLNQSQIRDQKQKKKDQIMSIHTDITLKNTSLKDVNEKMLSMKQRASKVSFEFC